MKILFIGNSHTYYNDMPSIFASLAKDNGHDVQLQTVTKGGWILHNYLDIPNEQTEMICRIASEEHFDLCFLQDQSLIPVADYAAFEDGVKRLMSTLRNAADGFVLYMTFGWQDGNPRLVENGLTFDSLCSGTIEAYTRLGQELDIPVSPVGVHFKRAVLERPDVPMFNEDHVHATYAGSCLIALTHYHTVFHELPENLSALDLPADTVAYFLDIIRQSNRK